MRPIGPTEPWSMARSSMESAGDSSGKTKINSLFLCEDKKQVSVASHRVALGVCV